MPEPYAAYSGLQLISTLGFIITPVMKPTVLFLLVFSTWAIGATNEQSIDMGDDFSPMCFALFLIVVLIALILVGVGIALTVIFAVFSALFAALGIVSSAAITGILRKRFSSGLRALHYQVCAVLSLPVAIGFLWIGTHLFSLHLRIRNVLALGSLAGIIGGLLLAFALDRIAYFVYNRFILPSISNKKEHPNKTIELTVHSAAVSGESEHG